MLAANFITYDLAFQWRIVSCNLFFSDLIKLNFIALRQAYQTRETNETPSSKNRRWCFIVLETSYGL